MKRTLILLAALALAGGCMRTTYRIDVNGDNDPAYLVRNGCEGIWLPTPMWKTIRSGAAFGHEQCDEIDSLARSK